MEEKLNILERENENLVLKNKRLLENTAIDEDVKRVELLKWENDTLHKVLRRTFEGNKHLDLLIKGCKHSFNKRRL